MADELEQRLVELETRLAFQESTIAELNEALSALRLEAAANAGLLKRLIEGIKLTRGEFGGDAASEPPPPHY
jgi:SlyX protein